MFQGGRTLEAIEAVCNAEGDLEVDVLDGVESLVDRSLMRQVEGVDGEPRFVMLETIHEYAREKLEESGQAAEMQHHHALYFVALAEEVEPNLQGRDQTMWFDRLEEELDNIRAVMAWCRREESGAEGAHIGLRLARALFWYWYARGPYSEVREWVEAVLSKTGAGEPTVSRGWALRTAGMLADILGDSASSRSFEEEGLVIARKVGQRQLEGSMLNNLGLTAHEGGDYARVRSLYEQSLVIHRELEHKFNIAIQLNHLGRLMRAEGDLASARAHHEEALSMAQELGDKNNVALSLQWLGQLAYQEGDYPSARSLHEQALAIRKEIGDKPHNIWNYETLGWTALRQGNLARAAALFREGLASELELGSTKNIHWLAAGLGAVAGAQGDPERAARLFAAAGALRKAAGAEWPPFYQAEIDLEVTTARSQLGKAEWEKAGQEGQAMTLEQAIAYALEEVKAAETCL